jgi:aspartate/methionine/tyrosine aminotransferase
VDIDPVIIINGLTKNWRCPGFRVCWIVAPKPIVEMLGSAGRWIIGNHTSAENEAVFNHLYLWLHFLSFVGSFLDGGANAPLQKLSLPLMELDFIRRDAWALQRTFRKKRDYLLTELARIGISVKWKPTATFYVWADISALPCPLNDCLVFLEECVKYKVICVPGVFFDINPRNIRNIQKNKCINFVR